MNKKKLMIICSAIMLSGCSASKIELLPTIAQDTETTQGIETTEYVTAYLTTEQTPEDTESDTSEEQPTEEQPTEEQPTEEQTEATTETVKEKVYLTRDDWAQDVKQAVNDLVDICSDAAGNEYAVFDFDNTCAIFDVESQTFIYVLQHLTLNLEPEKLREVLGTGLDTSKVLSGVGLNNTYADYIDDIVSAYGKLTAQYGIPGYKGVPEGKLPELWSDESWQEFATKMKSLWGIVWSLEPGEVASPWGEYWFNGMSFEEVYDIAYRSHDYYSRQETSIQNWSSPDIASKVGKATTSWTCGVQVTPNIPEIMSVLKSAGINVYVCSASMEPVIKAAVDCWGLSEYVDGILAMTIARDANGRYINSYDYSSAVGTQTSGEGKVTAINNVLVSQYGHGPVAGFMDSSGDFNFCTEYNSLKMVMIFNRGNRGIRDGGGLLAEVAIYERDCLGYNLARALENGDTLYVLQGRNENGLRSLISSNSTIIYGTSEYRLFNNDENEAQLASMVSQGMSVKAAIDTFAMRTDNYGFLEKYNGYHSR